MTGSRRAPIRSPLYRDSHLGRMRVAVEQSQFTITSDDRRAKSYRGECLTRVPAAQAVARPLWVIRAICDRPAACLLMPQQRRMQTRQYRREGPIPESCAATRSLVGDRLGADPVGVPVEQPTKFSRRWTTSLKQSVVCIVENPATVVRLRSHPEKPARSITRPAYRTTAMFFKRATEPTATRNS